MARPRKTHDEDGAVERMEIALLELVQDEPLERIPVSAVTKAAGCSRSAFYYHYADIYDLFDRLVDKHLPSEQIGRTLATMLAPVRAAGTIPSDPSSLDVTPLIDEINLNQRANLDVLRKVLSSKARERLATRLKDAAFKEWSSLFGGPDDEPNESARIVFEFAFGGILGALSYQATLDSRKIVENIQNALTPQIPQALLACLLRAIGTPHS